jgi:putative transcriptional regulator
MRDIPIGNNIRKLRFENGGMTQADLSKAVGVARQTIIALEAGHYAPSLELAMKLAAVFSCTVDDIFFWTDPDAAPSSSSSRK